MNGIIYCRVSSKDQVEGTSLESQEAACQDFARAKHLTILKVFVEQGESAKFADRTQLLELLDFCKQNKGRIQALLVWKIDRFARNVEDHYSLKATLFKYGVQILSVTEPIDNDPNGKLMETILAGFAQFDNDIRAMRTVQGMRRKLQEGIFPWKAPFGYVSSTTNGDKKTEPDRPDPTLFPLLQKAWQEFATGAYTKAEMRRMLAHWGVATAHGEPVSPQSLDNLFGNPFYAGILVDPWSGQEHQGRHMPIVTRQEFARVQQLIERRNRPLPHQAIRPEFVLRRSVRCPKCHHFLTGSFSRGRTQRYPYYFCYNRVCGKHRTSYPAEAVHEEFDNFLTEVTIEPTLLDQVLETVVTVAKEEGDLLKAKQARWHKRRENLNEEVQELIRMRAKGLITDQEFSTQKRALYQQRMSVDSTTPSSPLTTDELSSAMTVIKERATNLRETWQAFPDPFRRRFVQCLLPVGFCHTKVRTAELGLLFRVTDAFQDGQSTGVSPRGIEPRSAA